MSLRGTVFVPKQSPIRGVGIAFILSTNEATNKRMSFDGLGFGQNHGGSQKPVFSRQIAVQVDLKQVDSAKFRWRSH